MSLKRRADPLRFIALRLNLPEMVALVRTPGVSEAYRVTIQYHDARHPDQVATLIFRQGAGGSADLSVHYRRASGDPLVLLPNLPIGRCREFAAALRALNFDTLDDMADTPWFGADLWLIERASGSFQHDLVLAPERATGTHAAIAAVIRELLREAVRAINP